MNKIRVGSWVVNAWQLVALIFILTFILLRVYGLQTSPPGLFVDESSIGYNAWSILKTGRDEKGAFLPLYFEAFGDYKNPLYVYSAALVFSLFGPSILTLRLVSCLWGMFAIGVFFRLLRYAKASRATILVSLLLIVSNPWLFQVSRVAFEVAAFPFFQLLACLAFFVLSVYKQNKKEYPFRWLLCFALSLGGLFYAYTSGKLLAPLLFGVGFLLLWTPSTWKKLLVAASVFSLCLAPAFVWELSHPGALLARYQIVGLSNYTHGVLDFLRQASANYLATFLPHFLIGGGDGNLRHVSSPMGVLLIASVPFLLAGIFSLFARNKSVFSWWVLAGTILAPIPSALTIQSPHVLRSVGLLAYLCIFFWWGVEYLLSQTKMKYFVAACIVLLLIESLLFFSFYFGSYTRNAQIWFDSPTVSLIEAGVRSDGPYYLSSKLYPGTYATVDFMRIVSDPSVVMPLPETVVFDPQIGIPVESGTYFFDNETCRSLPQVQQTGNCIYTRR